MTSAQIMSYCFFSSRAVISFLHSSRLDPSPGSGTEIPLVLGASLPDLGTHQVSSLWYNPDSSAGSR